MNKTGKGILFNVYWDILEKTVRRPYIKKVRESFARSRLEDLTIISSNCIAGEIYHDLGLRFCSPTINLWMSESDCIQYASHINDYGKSSLMFIENSESSYPIAKLNDITVHFLHYKSRAEAEAKWRARSERILPENMYLIMNDQDLDDSQVELFHQIRGFKRKILFTTDRKRAKLDDVFLISMYPENSYVRNYAVNRKNGYRDFEKFFDFVSWLEGKQI